MGTRIMTWSVMNPKTPMGAANTAAQTANEQPQTANEQRRHRRHALEGVGCYHQRYCSAFHQR